MFRTGWSSDVEQQAVRASIVVMRYVFELDDQIIFPSGRDYSATDLRVNAVRDVTKELPVPFDIELFIVEKRGIKTGGLY